MREGLNLVSQGKFEQAYNAYNAALNMHPGSNDALFGLGSIMLKTGQFGAGINVMMGAVRNGAKRHELFNNIGNCFRGMGRTTEAEEVWKEALHLMERHEIEDADVYNNLATICVNADRAEEAEMWCKKALKINPEHVQAGWNLCLAYLEQGKLEQGWDLHYMGYRTGGRMNKQYDCGPWDGDHVKRLVIFGEQGQGDEILFASIIPDAMEACDELIIDCHPRLEGLFKRSFGEKVIATYPTRKSPETGWIYDHHPIDAKISIGDLAVLFRRKLEHFPAFREGGYKPFLKTNPAIDYGLKQRVNAAAGDKMKIGIAWEGGTLKTHFLERAVPFEYFKALIDEFGDRAEFFSVHYKSGSENFLQAQGVKVHHWQEVVDNLDALTSLVGAMDLTITADQTIIHQAGAIDAPCWVALPKKHSWRFPKKVEGVPLTDRMPWYGSNLKLFRQAKADEWGPVFADIRAQLERKLPQEPEEDGQPTADIEQPAAAD
ncbi:MAG: tetratricopeptide repeat protein [Planctomycetota bacterium]